MATFSVSASELKNASGSSWSSDRARQGVYSTTRYEGAIRFGSISDIDFSNIEISQIQMKATFGEAGGDSTKYLTFYKAAKNEISGSISSMRGDSIGAVAVVDAYGDTRTITFNSTTNSAIYSTLKSYFSSGNETQIIYVPSTRGTYSGGYCYDYLSITAMTLEFTFQYLESDGAMATASVAAGSAAKINITAYNSAYTHKVIWRFGSYSNTQSVAAGVTSASYTIPMSWLNAIPSATSGAATATLETYNTSGVQLGSTTYGFTITAPSSVIPSIGSVTITPVNSNTVISGWGIFVQGKTQATIKINNAAGAYGSTIKSYSISNSYLGSVQSSTMTTATINRNGTFTMTAKVTDSRGRTATKTASFTVYAYAAPAFSSITMYRCNSAGTRSDTEGTYGYVKASFGCSALNGSNKVTATAKLMQVGGSYTQSTSLTSGTGVVMGGGNLAVDATYSVVLTLTDTVGTISTYTGEISSAAYIMHIKKGGRAVGFGMAAGEDETVSFGWKVKLENPLEVTQGGTGGSTASAACANIGAVKKSGDTMTGNLSISGYLYPSLNLMPTYNGTGNRTVFEGSYVGASSFSSWEDSTGNNRRMLEVRNGSYQSDLNHAVVLRDVDGGTYYTYRMFHAGMETPIPIANGGTAATTSKSALNNLGIFYSATQPSSGTDGQICLVPV